MDSVAQVDRRVDGDTGRGVPTPPAPGRDGPAGAVVSVSHLTKAYGQRTAVAGVSLGVGSGITGLLGPNGAGKSTLLRCLAGLAGWNSGEVRICGLDLERRAAAARRLVGFLPERVAFPAEMRVEDYLRFTAEMKGIPRRTRAEAIDAALCQATLEEVRARIVGNLSKGYRQRVGLAQALLGDPPVLILDEPSAGLDPLHVMEFRDVIRDCARDRTVLVSTHVLPEARLLCDRVVVMSAGRVVYDGPTVGMVDTGRSRGRVRLRVRPLLGDDQPPVVDGAGAVLVHCQGDQGGYVMVVEVDGEATVAGLVARLVAAGWAVLGVEPTTDALEDAFRQAVIGKPR